MLTEVRISWFILKCVAKEVAEGERLKMFIFSQTLTVPCIHKNWARNPGNILRGANFESIGSQNVRCWYLEWHLTGSEPKLKLNFPTPDTVFPINRCHNDTPSTVTSCGYKQWFLCLHRPHAGSQIFTFFLRRCCNPFPKVILSSAALTSRKAVGPKPLENVCEM
jgi:hypothetical protein